MKSGEGQAWFDYLEEQVRMACVRLQVERTSVRLTTTAMTREQAEALVEQTRRGVLAFCPEKDAVFDLVLQPRFKRQFQERVLAEWGLSDSTN